MPYCKYCDIAGFLFLWFYHYLFLCAWDDHIFLVIHGLRLFDQNVYRRLPMIAACLSIPYGIYAFHLDLRVLCIAFFAYLLAMIDHREIGWIQKN